MGSRSQDFVVERLINFDTSFSVVGVKVDRNADGLMLSRVRFLSFEDRLNFSVISSQIILILSVKKSANRLTISVTFSDVDNELS